MRIIHDDWVEKPSGNVLLRLLVALGVSGELPASLRVVRLEPPSSPRHPLVPTRVPAVKVDVQLVGARADNGRRAPLVVVLAVALVVHGERRAEVVHQLRSGERHRGGVRFGKQRSGRLGHSLLRCSSSRRLSGWNGAFGPGGG